MLTLKKRESSFLLQKLLSLTWSDTSSKEHFGYWKFMFLWKASQLGRSKYLNLGSVLSRAEAGGHFRGVPPGKGSEMTGSNK
jgi:hypothetical protein